MKLLLIILTLSACQPKPAVYDVIGSMSNNEIDYKGLTVTAKGKVKFEEVEK